MARPLLHLAFAAGMSLPVCAQETPALDLFTRADKGHCIACHQLPPGAGPVTRSNLGPALTGARMRELGRAKVRDALRDPTGANPATVMPPYGRHRILEAREIERLSEFLLALP